MIKKIQHLNHCKGQVTPLALLLVFISSFLLLSIVYNTFKYHWAMKERRQTYLCAYQIYELYTELVKKIGMGNVVLASLNVGMAIPGTNLESMELKKIVTQFQDLSFMAFLTERLKMANCLPSQSLFLQPPYKNINQKLDRDPFSLAIPQSQVPPIILQSNQKKISKEFAFSLHLNFSKINKMDKILKIRVTEEKGKLWN